MSKGRNEEDGMGWSGLADEPMNELPMSQAQKERKEYLGDAVYVRHDGYHVWLTTEDGIRATNEIALDPYVLESLFLYVKRLNESK